MAKQTFKLITNEFEAIQVSGDPKQFSELKGFCKDDIEISYETADGIGDFWNIRLHDVIKDALVVVPNSSYIMKVPFGFTLVTKYYMDSHFEEIKKSSQEEYLDRNPNNVEGD